MFSSSNNQWNLVLRRVLFSVSLLLASAVAQSQTGTFLALDNNDNLYKVTISSSGCSSLKTTGCHTSSPVSTSSNSLLSIALDNTLLYIVDNTGALFSCTYNSSSNATSNCRKLGTFASGNGIYGLTVGPNGIVYAANANEIESYTPTSATTGTFKSLGFVNAKYSIGGDLLFYGGKLYEAVNVNNNTNDNRLLEINLSNIAASTEYLTFNAGTKVFGFASVTVPCSNNQSYALSSGATTNIYAVDMVTKTQSAAVFCTLGYNVYDAASVAETQTATAPNAPTVTSPFNICLNSTVPSIAPTADAGDTLRWYTTISSGVPTGTPKGTPVISSASISSATYYVTQFDVTTKCESQPSTIVVNVVALPTISITNTAQSICQNTASTAITATANAGSGTISNYQWYSNTTATTTGGTLIASAVVASYTPPTNVVGTTYYYCVVTNSNGCTTTSNISGAIVVKAPSASSTAISVCPSALPYTWNGTPYATAGTYTKTFTNAVGCDSIATLVLTVKATSTSNTAVSICPSALPYTWNSTPYAAAGTYTKTLTNAVGCDSVATLVLTVKATSTSNTAVSICPSALPYTWNGTAYNAAGTYTKTLTNAVGCDSVATLVLTVKATSTSNTAVSICSSALPYTWNGTAYNAAGTYTKTLTNAVGCDSVATLVLTVKATSTSSTAVSICSSALPYSWNGTAYNAAGTYTKTLTNAVGCDSVATLVLSVKQVTSSTTNATICAGSSYTFNGTTYTTAGTYTKTLTNAVGCDSIATLNLVVETFTASLSANPTPAFGGVAFTAQLTANLPIASSVWLPSNLFVNNQSSQTIKAPDTSFTLIVTAVSANGCRSTVTKPITVFPSTNTIFVPNALTPAAVGTDASVIKVYGTTVKTASMLVYNQWGQLLFKTDSATTKGWDGTFNGKMQPSGTYTYVVQVLYQNNTTETKSGTINLIR